jgi:hypothetical protein
MRPKDNTKFTFQLSNKNRSASFFLLFIASGVIFTGMGFFLIGIESTLPLIALIVFAVAYFIVFTKVRPSFFEFLVLDDRFQINYYSVANVTREYQSVEVIFTNFKSIDIRKSFGGMKKELIISVETAYGIADYPPISISILKKKEIDQLVYVLQKIANPQPRSE